MAGSNGVLAGAVVRHRRLVAGAWVLLAAALAPAARRAERVLDVAARVPGSESDRVPELLRRRFGSAYATYVTLVVTGVPGPSTDAGRAALFEVVQALGNAPGVTKTFSYLDAPDSLFAGRTGGTFVLVGLDTRRGPPDRLIPGLRTASAGAAARLRDRFPVIALRWTGDVPLNYDIRRASADDARGAERRALPITLTLLLAGFGTVAAGVLPVLTGALAIMLALGGAVLINAVWPLSILLQNVVSMLGLGLGIDYALLMVSRFREALAEGLDPEAAAVETARSAGHTVALSGLAVAIGFLALLLVPLNELRAIAVGGCLIALASVAIATTLVPGLLAWLGHRLARRPRARAARRVGDRWRAWGRWVGAHPVATLAAFGTPVVVLATLSLGLVTGLPRARWLPPAMESARGAADLEAMGRSGVVQTLRVVLLFPRGVAALSPEGWAATLHLGEGLERDPRVARVRSLPALAGGRRSANLLSLLPTETRRNFVSADGGAALLDVVPREDAQPSALVALVRDLRAADPAKETGLAGTRVLVGGLPAFNADYEQATAGRFFGVVALVVIGTLIVLAAAFRAVLVPVKAVVLNLLSVAAAFGAVVLVFQDGHGAAALGVSAPLGAVFPALPLLVFCTVFGLSMDYEVFLVARVAEARGRGLPESEAVAEAMARTGGVITAAAAIMIAVFGAFTLGGFLLIKMLGFALAVAVFLDATLVRLAIGPALLVLAGHWNWWPGAAAPRAGARVRGGSAEHLAGAAPCAALPERVV